MGDMADWQIEQMEMPCEFCGKIHAWDDDDDCVAEEEEDEVKKNEGSH